MEINTFTFSHFADGKTGTETVSNVLQVTASKRNEEASPGSGPARQCEPVPAARPLIRPADPGGSPALAGLAGSCRRPLRQAAGRQLLASACQWTGSTS